MVELDAHVIVITGASTGIGAEVARQASARGAAVVLTARRAEELNAVAAQCGEKALAVVADVTKREDVERVAAAAIEKFGHYTDWVNNVGRGLSRPPSELTDEDIDIMMNVNVKSALYGMQVATRHFKERNCGHVINISSMLGRKPSVIPRSAYSASKHFLNALTANMRDEVSASHPQIAYSLVSPGLVYTEFGSNALHGGVDNRSLRASGMGQEEEEVAKVIVDTVSASRSLDVYTKPGYKAQVMTYLDELTKDP
mmetsp:Transcript_34847/g.116469  ORF Transcript_34847/g.116469 Transcript_34847/m.116469 type:complete len:256 (-) Transcript_34847:423-1190(-)